MRYRDLRRWDDLDQLAGLKFFYQRMEELTFSYTCDSYKAPTTNCASLLSEALDLFKNSDQSTKAAFHVLDEFRSRIKKNKPLITLLNVPVDELLNFDSENIDEVISRLEIMSKEVKNQSYAVALFVQLEIEIVEGNKNDIDFYSRELVSALSNLGMSSEFILQMVLEVFGRRKINKKIQKEQLKVFFKRVFPHHHKTVVCFKLRSDVGIINPENASRFGVEIRDNLPKEFSKISTAGPFSKLKKNEKFLVTQEFRSFDFFSAIDIASKKVSRLQNMFKIFSHKQGFELYDEVIVHQCCRDDARKAKRNLNLMQLISDNRADVANQKLSNLLNKLQLQRGKDSGKFFGAVEFHGLALASDVVENQLLNIWIATETLCPISPKFSIIDNVVRFATPIICLKYYHKIYSQLKHDLFRWNAGLIKKTLSQIIDSNPSGMSEDEALFALMTVKKYEENLSKLFIDMRDFELLRHRFYSLSKVFSDPAKTLKKVEKHQRNIEWQFRRIYRTRNQIVHTGTVPSYTGSLLENAHRYFDQMLSHCCDLSSGGNGFSNIDQCHTFSSLKYDHYKANFSRAIVNNTKLELSDLLWTRKTVDSLKTQLRL